MWGSTTSYHRYVIVTDANFTGKTVFFWNNRGVNRHCACLGDSGPDVSTEESVSGDVANAHDCRSDSDEFGSCRSGLAKFTRSCRQGDSDGGSDYDGSTACQSGLAKFTKSCHNGDSDRGSDDDEFGAYRNGLAKSTKPC